MGDETGVIFGIGTGLVVGTDLAAGAFSLPAFPTAFALILVAGLFGARLRVLLAGALALVSWAFYTGFTENRFGQLTFTGADLARIFSFVGGALVVAMAIRRVLITSRDEAEARHG